MRRLFLPDADLAVPSIRISGPDHHHLVHVLRMRIGEELILLDNRGEACRCEIVGIDKREIEAAVLGPAETIPEPAIHVTIAQAIGKGDKFEQVIQHGTEIGASAFIPLITERTIVRPAGKEAGAKVIRWQAVAKSAAEQAGRSRMPVIYPVASLQEVLEERAASTVCWMLDQSGPPVPVSAAISPQLLLVGPEGGISPAEMEAALAAGVWIVSVSRFTLRTETAALAALSRLFA